MKIINMHIPTLLLVICLGIFINSEVKAQEDQNLKTLSFYFDTLHVNSPLYVSGLLPDIENIRGVSIKLSVTSTSIPLINDTLLIVGSHGSYYTLWNDVISPAQGFNINGSIINTCPKGIYYCGVSILYKNGTTSNARILSIKK